jgi:hypothetical protein
VSAERAGQLVKAATGAGALGFLRLAVLESVPMQASHWEAAVSAAVKAPLPAAEPEMETGRASKPAKALLLRIPTLPVEPHCTPPVWPSAVLPACTTPCRTSPTTSVSYMPAS